MELVSKMKRQKAEEEKKKGCAWEDLDGDILINIYQRLDFKDLIVGAPLCCGSWYKPSKDPSVWRNVDLHLFSKQGGKLFPSTQLIEFVVARSRGSLISLKFPISATMEDLLYVADRCPGLKHFLFRFPFYRTIPNRESVSMKIFSKLKELESMDVDKYFINEEPTLELINRFCPNFTTLKIFDKLCKKTAFLICHALPKLKTIDLSSIPFLRREVVLIILNGCQELEKLDLTGCGKIHGEDEILGIGLRCLKEFKRDEEEEVHYSWCDSDCVDPHYFDYIVGTKAMLDNKYRALEGHIEEHELHYGQFYNNNRRALLLEDDNDEE